MTSIALASPDPFEDREPTDAELTAIEAEWPVIEAELALLEVELDEYRPSVESTPMTHRRVRRRRRRVLAAASVWEVAS